MPKLSLKILACEIAQREINFASAQSPHLLDLEFLPVGHHDEPQKGRLDLQTRLEAVPAEKYDAILVGYGICSQMLNGLTARHTPLVIPRAHDCITFFLGSKERYERVFRQCPGTYYFTAGWIEFPQRKTLRQSGLGAFREMTEVIGNQASPFGLGQSFSDLVAKYGEENARYILEVTQRWADHYDRGALISFDCTAHLGLGEKVKCTCRKRGWRFEELPGDLGLLQRWLAGQWDDPSFLIVPPKHRVLPSYNERIIEAQPADLSATATEAARPLPIDHAPPCEIKS